MSKMITIHQPCYIPYLGVFYKIWRSDVFVFLDNVQYSSGSPFAYNKIKTSNGECRLRIPINHHFGDLLTDVKTVDSSQWKSKHLKTIEMNYKKAPYFKMVYDDFAQVLCKPYESLAEINEALMEMFILKNKFNTDILIASDMPVKTTSEQRIIDIVKYVKGDSYMSGIGGRNYQDESHFIDAGIRLEYSQFEAVPYPQLWGDFVPNMSIIDYCMNNGYTLKEFFNGESRNQNCRS